MIETCTQFHKGCAKGVELKRREILFKTTTIDLFFDMTIVGAISQPVKRRLCAGT